MPLSHEQTERAKKVYQPGDLVDVEYRLTPDGDEQKGHAQVVCMLPASRATRQVASTPMIRLKWLYTYDDLLKEEGGPDEEALTEHDLNDGDLAYSNLEQDMEVHCIVGLMSKEIPVRFVWDGESLKLSDTAQAEAQQHDELTEGMPEYKKRVKDWLLSDDPWSGKYGGDWLLTLNTLKNMGRDSNTKARDFLVDNFFETPGGEPIPGKPMTWMPLVGGSYDDECSACGCARRLTHVWQEAGWHVGGHCTERLSVMRRICAYMFEQRAQARASNPYIPESMLESVCTQLYKLRAEAVQCIHFERHAI